MARNHFHFPGMKKFLLAFVAPLGAALALNAGAANALMITVNVGGTDYNLTTVSSSFNDLLTAYGNPPSASVMPWYSSSTLADAFATAVTGQLGDQYVMDTASNTLYVGALFGYADSAGITTFSAWDLSGSSLLSGATLASDESVTYAIVEPSPATGVPGPLPLLGAAAAFSTSRKLRRRVAVQKFNF